MAKSEHGFDVVQLKRLRRHLAEAVLESRDLAWQAGRWRRRAPINFARGLASSMAGLLLDVDIELASAERPE